MSSGKSILDPPTRTGSSIDLGDRDRARRISILSRILNGLLLPVALFILWQVGLVESTRGSGSFGGMMIFFWSLALVPAVIVLNLWVLFIRWRSHFRAFFAGLALPFAVGAAEFLFLYFVRV
jgi:hypothetical protein